MKIIEMLFPSSETIHILHKETTSVDPNHLSQHKFESHKRNIYNAVKQKTLATTVKPKSLRICCDTLFLK